MTLSARIAPAILDTVLGHLALLFLAGACGDLVAARDAAAQMLSAYDPETPDELRLAAEVISFGLHALEALGQAAAPDLAVTKVIRLRGSAVSLSREGHKAHRKLDQLQRRRRAGITEQPAAAAVSRPTAARPQLENARNGQTRTQSFQKREAARRIAENLRKNQLDHAAQSAVSTPMKSAAPAG